MNYHINRGRREGAAPGVETQRLFVGVPLPEELLPLVRRAQEGIGELPGLRLATPEQLHVTLAFIGEVDKVKADAARLVVEQVPESCGGTIKLGGYLALPSATRARVVALELEDEGSVLQSLFEHVMSGLEQKQVMKREKRPFRPHLTIARLRVPSRVQPKYECESADFAVSSVCLYRSQLQRTGAVYSVIARRALSAR